MDYESEFLSTESTILVFSATANKLIVPYPDYKDVSSKFEEEKYWLPLSLNELVKCVTFRGEPVTVLMGKDFYLSEESLFIDIWSQYVFLSCSRQKEHRFLTADVP